MNDYVRLTKSVDKDGELCVACAKLGTQECAGNCASCETMRDILRQLWAFEELYAQIQK